MCIMVTLQRPQVSPGPQFGLQPQKAASNESKKRFYGHTTGFTIQQPGYEQLNQKGHMAVLTPRAGGPRQSKPQPGSAKREKVMWEEGGRKTLVYPQGHVL